jgi:adenylate cyclase
MADVFISYSRDDRDDARRIADAFKAEGFEVWWDAALRTGETFDTVIERALAEAKAVVVLWSPNSVDSRWVRAEATQADQNRTLAPVIIAPCKRPIIFELIHTTDLSRWRGDRDDAAWKGLVEDVRALVARTAAAPPPVAAPPPAPARRQAERRQVTVVNAAIAAGEGAADLDPEDWREMVSRFQGLAAQTIRQHGGEVESQPGDAVVGLFGADQTQEDDADRAVRAALAIVELAGGLDRRGAEPSAIRAGVDTGLMVVGGSGGGGFGAPLAQAAALQAQAPPGAVAISAANATLAGELLHLEPMGPRAFKVVGLRPVRTRFDLSKARGLSQFVGRRADLQVLEDALARADSGDGQVVGVVAEPGVGKSRLCFEFLEHCRANGIRVLEGRASANGRNVPFLAVLEIFRSFFDIRPEDEPAVAREKIGKALAAFDANVGDAEGLVADFLSVADPEAPPLRMDPDTRQRQIFGLMRHLIRKAGERQLSVTLIEDLHWLDPASAQFVEQMVEARSGSRGLLLLNYRPEYRADWLQSAWCRQIALTPLPQDAIGELLADLLGPEANRPSLTGMIEARTGGNPFFVEEVVRNLAETGHLQGERGAYRLVSTLDRIEVPATVTAAIAARIDRLRPQDREILQTASVIGMTFSEPLIRTVSGLSDAALAEALGALRRGDFITEVSVFPVVEYAFRHPLTQDTAQGSLLRDRRREIHRAIAEALEAQGEGRLDERAAMLAGHWEQAGEPLKAAQRHRQAAEWVALTDPNAAVWHWGKVRSLLAGLTDDPAAAGLGVAACQHLLNLSWRFTANPDEIKGLYEEGLAFARATGDRATELKVSMVYGRACCSLGDLATYIRLATEIYEGAQALGDYALKANAALYLVDARVYTAQFPDAVGLAEAGLATFREPVPPSEWIMGFNPTSALRFWRAVSLTIMGRIPDGLAAFADCFQLWEADGTPEAVVYLWSWSATAYLTQGDVERLQACAQSIDQACTAMGDPPTIVAHRKLCETYLHLASGRPVEAIATAEAALAIHRMGERQHEGASLMFVAEAQLWAGQLDAAVATARETIDVCRAALRGNLEAMALGILARALLRRDAKAGYAEACAALDQAEALIARTGAETVRPSLLEWRAEAAGVNGDAAAREALLAQAAERFEAIGAPLQAGRLRISLDA